MFAWDLAAVRIIGVSVILTGVHKARVDYITKMLFKD